LKLIQWLQPPLEACGMWTQKHQGWVEHMVGAGILCLCLLKGTSVSQCTLWE
jgi:hypothetical protein